MSVARHQVIAEDLRKKIYSGEYAPGSQLPTEPQLEAHYRASRNTVRVAVNNLVSEGLIQVNRGLGMYVPDSLIPFRVLLSEEEGGRGRHPGVDSYRAGVLVTGRRPEVRNFTATIEYPSAEIAGLLEISEDEQVAVRGSQRYIDDDPYSMQRSYYPMDIARGTELESRNGIARGTIEVLRELGYEQVGTRDNIRARMPTPEERSFFQVGLGVPVFVVYRMAYASAYERPIRLTVTVYPADRNQLSYDDGDVPARQLAEGEIPAFG
ncbi:MAG TPA: GntR family transcriptional regulator [Actinoallomurus sp.]